DVSGNAITTATTQFVFAVTPPEIVSVIASDNQTVRVLFNEEVSLSSSQDVSNYTADNGLGNPVSAIRDMANPALVHLHFGSSFANAVIYQLNIQQVEDLQGTSMLPVTE